MKKSTAFGICTTFFLFGLLSLVLAFSAEVEDIKVSENDQECENYKMKAFKLGIASTTALLCLQLYAAYIFSGCCQCKEIGLDVSLRIRCFYILGWILSIIDFAILLDVSVKVKYRLEDKSPGDNLCSATGFDEQNEFSMSKPFPSLGVITLVVALTNITSFSLIYKWTKEPIPEKNTLLNIVPNMWYVEEVNEKYCMEQSTDQLETGINGEVVLVRRVRVAVYWERTVKILTTGNVTEGRITAPPSSPSRRRSTMKRWIHNIVLLLVTVGASTLSFLAEVMSIKHSYLHGDCIEMKTAAYKLGFASAALLLFSIVYYLVIVGCDAARHYNGLARLIYSATWMLAWAVVFCNFAVSMGINMQIEEHTSVVELCPIRKAHTLRIRFGFSLDGILSLVVLILELIIYNYLQVHPNPKLPINTSSS